MDSSRKKIYRVETEKSVLDTERKDTQLDTERGLVSSRHNIADKEDEFLQRKYTSRRTKKYDDGTDDAVVNALFQHT